MMPNEELAAAMAVRARFSNLYPTITLGQYFSPMRKDVSWIAHVNVAKGKQQQQRNISVSAASSTATVVNSVQQEHGPVPTIPSRGRGMFPRQRVTRKGAAEAETAAKITVRDGGNARTVKGARTGKGKAKSGGSATGATATAPRVGSPRRKNRNVALIHQRQLQLQLEQQERQDSSTPTTVKGGNSIARQPTSPNPEKNNSCSTAGKSPRTRPKPATGTIKAARIMERSASCVAGEGGIGVAVTAGPRNSADVVQAVKKDNPFRRPSGRVANPSPFSSHTRSRSRARRAEALVPEGGSLSSPDSPAGSSPPSVSSRVCTRTAAAATAAAAAAAARSCTTPIAKPSRDAETVVAASGQGEPAVVTVAVAAVKTTPVPAPVASSTVTVTSLTAAPVVGVGGVDGVAAGKKLSNNKVDGSSSMASGSKTTFSCYLTPIDGGRRAAHSPCLKEVTSRRMKVEETEAPTARETIGGGPVDCTVVGPRLLRARMEREKRRAAGKAAAAAAASPGAAASECGAEGGFTTTSSIAVNVPPAAESTQHTVGTQVQLPVRLDRHDRRDDADDASTCKRHRANNYSDRCQADGGGGVMVDAVTKEGGQCGAAMTPRRGLVDSPPPPPPPAEASSRPLPGPLGSDASRLVERRPKPSFADEVSPATLRGGGSVVRRGHEAADATADGGSTRPSATVFRPTTHVPVDAASMAGGCNAGRAAAGDSGRTFRSPPRWTSNGMLVRSPTPLFGDGSFVLNRAEALGAGGGCLGGDGGWESGGGGGDFYGGGAGCGVELISPPPRLPGP